VGIDENGDLICAIGGAGGTTSEAIEQIPVSACADILPATNKRIFVTQSTFPGQMDGAVGSDPVVNADAKCQEAATDAGLTGTFEALFSKNYDHVSTVLTGQNYWNGSLVADDQCNWHLVATGMSDFFTDKGSGVYLQNPISYNEYGTLNDTVVSGQNSNRIVWTDIKPLGNGNYSYFQQSLYQNLCSSTACIFTESTSPCLARWCTSSPMCWDSNYWVGSTTSKGMTWAYTSVRVSDPTGNLCRSTLKYALYCVEQ